MMLGSKGLLPPTDVHELFRSKAAPAILEHEESADLLRKSLLPHVRRVPRSKALSCKHERLFDLLTLASFYQVLLKICVFDEPWVGMAVWLVACRNKKSTSWIHIPT